MFVVMQDLKETVSHKEFVTTDFSSGAGLSTY